MFLGGAGGGALGAGVGALTAGEGQRARGALTGGVTGAAIGGLTGALAARGGTYQNVIDEVEQVTKEMVDEALERGLVHGRLQMARHLQQPQRLIETLGSMKPETMQSAAAELLKRMGPEKAEEVVKATTMTGPWWKRMFT